jgi:Skp family chaperone for outer membrane proteins
MRTLLLASFAFLSLATAAGGQEPFPVALLNMDKVVKTYKPFQDKLVPLKESAQDFEKKVQLRQIELETVVTQLRKAPPGSQEAQRLQQQAMKLQTEMQQFVAKEREGLQKREALALLELHRQVEEELKKYCKDKGIKIVIRQQDTSLDDNQPPAEIIKALNRGIIYEDGLDITDDILKALDARNAAAAKPE